MEILCFISIHKPTVLIWAVSINNYYFYRRVDENCTPVDLDRHSMYNIYQLYILNEYRTDTHWTSEVDVINSALFTVLLNNDVGVMHDIRKNATCMFF